MNIVVAGTEAVPYIKVGGLGDVLGALPGEYARNGHKVSVILPYYSIIKKTGKFSILKIKEFASIPVELGNKTYSFGIYKLSPKENNTPQIYFIDNPEYFHREGIYSHANNMAYDDEGERWLFYQKTVIETVKLLNLEPDIIHVNDFHTAMIPALIRFRHRDYFSKTKTLLTLHNLLFQGVYDKSVFDMTNIPETEFYPYSAFEYYGNINFVKTGIIFADAVNTVSPNYAKELLEIPDFSYGLYDILQDNAQKFSGILNGADYNYWNPEADPLLPVNYNSNTLEKKKKNRRALLKIAGLKDEPNTIVAGIVARMTDQKGFVLLLEAWRELQKKNMILIILASGDKDLEEAWQLKAEEFPEKIFFSKDFNEELAHIIQAGADIFLMPSQFEPCGLSQLYALKYGTPPLAFSTGGLADTITDNPEYKNGFLFYNYTVESFMDTFLSVEEIFLTPRWSEIQRNGMAKSFTWESAASKYLKLFDKLLSGN